MMLDTSPPNLSRWADIGLFWDDDISLRRGNPNSPWAFGHEAERIVCADLAEFPYVDSVINFRARIVEVIPVAPRDEWGGWQEGWRFVFEALGPSCIGGKTWVEEVTRHCVDGCPSNIIASRRLHEIEEMVGLRGATNPWQLIGIPFDASMSPV